jgi:hypothetical protein
MHAADVIHRNDSALLRKYSKDINNISIAEIRPIVRPAHIIHALSNKIITLQLVSHPILFFVKGNPLRGKYSISGLRCLFILMQRDRHQIFKVELQKAINEMNIPIIIVQYQPYTSKWNPIEHRVFPHVSLTIEGVLLNTVEEVKNKIETTSDYDARLRLFALFYFKAKRRSLASFCPVFKFWFSGGTCGSAKYARCFYTNVK